MVFHNIIHINGCDQVHMRISALYQIQQLEPLKIDYLSIMVIY